MSTSRAIIACDPGASGGLAVRYACGRTDTHKMPETPREVLELLEAIVSRARADADTVSIYLENVVGNAGGCKMAQQGFSFGRGYGHLEMACYALGLTRYDVTPRTWQQAMKVGSRGTLSTPAWKAKLRERAQRLYPDLKVINATADALLMLSYAVAQEVNP